jgi:uncharacterized protein YbcI
MATTTGQEPLARAARARRPAQGLAPLAHQIARIHRARYGKGPSRARAYAAGDVLTVVLEDCITAVEKAVHEAGRPELLAAIRDAVLPTIEPELRAAVESTLHRGVRAIMNAADPAAGAAALIFVLEEQPEQLRRRSERARVDSEAIRDASRAVRAQSEQAMRRASELTG